MTVCFTGPRPKKLYGYKKELYEPLVRDLVNVIKVLYEDGYDKYLTGGAQGFDQTAFWAINIAKRLGLPIKNIVYVPFAGQESLWAKTGLFSQQEYRLMLNLADEVKYLQNINKSVRNNVVSALYNRNHVMVDDADLVVGFYTGTDYETDFSSGTAECLRYAARTGKPIKLIKGER